jgi:Domain of unknown function (DUF4149)
MSTVLRTIEFLGLSLWLGSDVFLSFVVAPGAFRVLPSRDAAGAMVGFSLSMMHNLGLFCGSVLVFSRLLRTRTYSGIADPTTFVVFMMLLTGVSQLFVSPRMAGLRTQMGSIQATAADSPLLQQFGRLHAVSVTLESCVLLAGFVAMYLMVRELAVVR